MDVLLFDRGTHPRFAIGESSTPLADFLLEQIADQFSLPELKPLARWGSWQRTYPQLRCGKKRGFSYYAHAPDKPFVDDASHSRSLLVAASECDDVSDTHWMRSDVDHWLCHMAQTAGVRLVEDARVETIERSAGKWQVVVGCGRRTHRWCADWIVDATGAGGIVPSLQGVERGDEQLRTRTGSIFGHFTGVGSMSKWLKSNGGCIEDDPFDGDDAAQHHLLEDGWVWMLRFDCGVTSVGITRPTDIWASEGAQPSNVDRPWQSVLASYPTLAELMQTATLVGPPAPRGAFAGGSKAVIEEGASDQARLGWMPRLSRLWTRAAGPGWLALPSTVGVIDPLHSTGLAHALSGVKRVADLLLQAEAAPGWRNNMLEQYALGVPEEVRWIDRLVSTCYAALPDFELFCAASSFYFMAAIASERAMRREGRLPEGFLGYQNADWQSLLEKTYQALVAGRLQASPTERALFLDRLRQDIEPWNEIGLLDSRHRNRFQRSATKQLPACGIGFQPVA